MPMSLCTAWVMSWNILNTIEQFWEEYYSWMMYYIAGDNQKSSHLIAAGQQITPQFTFICSSLKLLSLVISTQLTLYICFILKFTQFIWTLTYISCKLLAFFLPIGIIVDKYTQKYTLVDMNHAWRYRRNWCATVRGINFQIFCNQWWYTCGMCVGHHHITRESSSLVMRLGEIIDAVIWCRSLGWDDDLLHLSCLFNPPSSCRGVDMSHSGSPPESWILRGVALQMGGGVIWDQQIMAEGTWKHAQWTIQKMNSILYIQIYA